MEFKRKPVDPEKYVTVTNLDGVKVELLRDSYEESALQIREILQDQEKLFSVKRKFPLSS